MTMKVEMKPEDYEIWDKIKNARRGTPEGKMLKIRKRQSKIEDPAVIAQIKFLFEKQKASRYGAEQLFVAAKEYHESIWLAIKAELPDCFPADEEDDDDTDKDGEFMLSKGKTYNHLLNAMTWTELYYEDIPAESDEETTFTANVETEDEEDEN